MGFPSRLSALDPVLGPGRQCRLPVRGCIALAAVIGTQLISRIGESWPSLEATSLLIFVLLAVLKNVLRGPVITRSSARSPKARSMFATRVQRSSRAIICPLRTGS
jgi:hypothetical protein